MRAFKILLMTMTLSLVQSPAADFNKELSKFLRKNGGFYPFTPFRTDALPGSIFIYGKDHRSRSTEWMLSPWNRSFILADSDIPFRTNRIALPKQHSETTFDFELGLGFLADTVKVNGGWSVTNDLRID